MKIENIRDLNKDQVLKMLGLEKRSSTAVSALQSLGLIGLGALLGAGVMLLMAPKSGREVREDLGRRLKSGAQDVVGTVREKLDRTQSSEA